MIHAAVCLCRPTYDQVISTQRHKNSKPLTITRRQRQAQLHLRMNVVCVASYCRRVCVWRRLCDPDEGSLKKTAQVIARARARLKGVERTTLAEFFLRLSSLSLRSLLGPFCLLQMLTPDIRHPGRPIHFLTIRRNRPNTFTKS